MASPHPRTVLLQGALEAEHTVQLAARVEGPLRSVHVDLGDRVRAGQVLARIDATDYRAHSAQARAELAQARTDLARYTDMEHPEAVARQTVELARTRVETAEASRALAARQLADTTARAPFDGAVVRRLVERGTFVRVGTPLFDLVSEGDLRLTLEIPERHLGEVRPGSTLFVLPGEAAEPRFEASVTRVAPAVSPATRTFRIEARVAPTHDTLRPGAFVVAVLTLGTYEDAVRIPRATVYSVLGRDRVMLVVDGKAESREVELLGEHEGAAFVRGITPDDLVMLGAVANLPPGTRVRVVAREPTP